MIVLAIVAVETVQELQDKIVALQSQVDSRDEEILRMLKGIDDAGAIIADSLRVMKGKQEDIDTLQHGNNKLQSQLQQARELICQQNEILQSTTSSIKAKGKEIHNKTEQVAYHRKKASDMQKQLEKTRLDLPKSCLTRIDAQQIVTTVRRILEDSCRSHVPGN
ncbi:hypothetical protein ACA910_014715 [Epithemia clementina (nom. ined.)]